MHVLPREGSITLSSSLQILEHDEELLLGHQGSILKVCWSQLGKLNLSHSKRLFLFIRNFYDNAKNDGLLEKEAWWAPKWRMSKVDFIEACGSRLSDEEARWMPMDSSCLGQPSFRTKKRSQDSFSYKLPTGATKWKVANFNIEKCLIWLR